MNVRKDSSGDRALGMDSEITRRDFLGTTLLASGAALFHAASPAQLLAAQTQNGSAFDWNGFGGVGEYANANGNTWEVLTAGHKLRDGSFEKPLASVQDTGEIFECVVIGGGISGLAAALFFQRNAGPNATSLVLENHPIFGGEARQNEFEVGGQRLIAHQGSAIYFAQYPRSFLAQFYDSIGLKEPHLDYQKWSDPGPEMSIGRTPYDSAGMSTGQYGFWFGAQFGQKTGLWQIDPVGKKFANAPVSDATKKELLRWYSGTASQATPFTPPKYEGDAISRHLDSISLEDHYIHQYGLSREFIRTFLSPDLGGGSGLGADALSAYSDYAAELLHPYEEKGEAVQMFPGGNTTIARLMVKTLIPHAISGDATVEGVSSGKINFSALDATNSLAKIRLNATAISVQHDGSPEKSNSVSIIYSVGEKLFRVRARSVVMAGGSWTAKHILRDLPQSHREAYAQFFRSPCMMANVALTNWRFLAKLGITGCRWFGIGNQSVGNYFELRRLATIGDIPKTISQDSPVVLTLKVLYSYPGLGTEDQGHRGRGEMITTSFREYERRIRQQLTDMFSGVGFDASRDIAGIILNRWGHAYLSPQPGFFFGKDAQPAPRDILRAAPFGRIAFANTDLAGAMDHRFSILEAQRAVQQLLDQVIAG
ncbi:MAG TPA: NAD(P)-binding protein [Candidatus Dormibacteraeota bacterium]|jgi:spermidine dehydrogenase|nr:NAD(P)-binding protein [Candidatus Dormibacteraeota bacterium]